MKKQTDFIYPYALTKLFVLLVFSFFLLFPGFHGYHSIQDEKAVSFYLLFGGYLFLMLLFTIEMMIMGHLKPISPAAIWKRASRSQKLAVVYMLVGLLATLCSEHRQQSWIGMSRYEGCLTIFLYGCCFLCVSVFTSDLRFLPHVFGGAMTVFCTVCLAQMQGYNPLGLYPEGITYYDANVAYPGIYLGTIGNADYVAAVLCMGAAFFGIRVFKERSYAEVWLLLPWLLCILVLYKLQVQAGLVALVCSGILIFPIVSSMGKKYKWISMGIIGLLGIVFLTAIHFLPVRGTLYELQQVMKGNWREQFGSGRIYIWKQVLQRVPDRLFLGTGPDTMMAANILGYDFVTPDGYVLKTAIDTAHNEYLNMLYHQGILGLFPYLWLLMEMFIKWVKKAPQNPQAAAYGGAVLSYCIQAFFGIGICMTSGIAWVFLGLLERSTADKERK